MDGLGTLEVFQGNLSLTSTQRREGCVSLRVQKQGGQVILPDPAASAPRERTGLLPPFPPR